MREDYAIQCIESSCFMAASSFVSESEKNSILCAANKMLNEVWKVECRSNNVLSKDQRMVMIGKFWDYVHTKLESEQKVHKFRAIWDETVNPPDREGVVVINVQPRGRAEWFVFNLTL